MKVVALVSGGMDSVCALHHAAREHEIVDTLSFDYGSKHNHREIPFARHHAGLLGVSHRVIPLGFVNELFSSDLLKSGGEVPDGHYEEATMKATFVPFGNGIMLSIAAGFAESRGAEGLVIAAHSGDHAIYPDCREAFRPPMAEAIRQGTYAGIEVLRPFIFENPLYVFRKEAGSIIYELTDSYDRAADFLRNDPRIAREHYVGSRRRLEIEVPGLNDAA